MGPVILRPASAVYGRKLPLFSGYLAFVALQIPVATARDARTILIYRLLGGVASSGSPAIVGGYMAHFLRPVERGVAVAIFAATTLIGPCAGNMVGSVLLQSSLGWRWTAWLSMILGMAFGLVGWIAIAETYVPVLLKRKARRLRLQTGNWALHTKSEESPVNIKDFAVRYLTRPFIMLRQEPILVLMTLYVSFSFGMLYFLFVAYPFSFIRERGYSPVSASTPLIAVIIGIVVGSVTTYLRKFREQGKVVPEDHLPPMIVGAAILAGVPIGASIQIITLQNLAYVLDIYTVDANSAVSGTVIVPSLLAGLFPLIAAPMCANLGAKWASSTVGLVGLAFLAVPILLYFYGAKIRSWSRYAPRT